MPNAMLFFAHPAVGNRRPLQSELPGEWVVDWEYPVITETSSDSKLGAEGWELVAAVSPRHFVLHPFFKRELRA